jgi:Rrf2 family protein
MRVSKRTDYALRALFTLIEEDGRRPISIRELAERNAVPKRFLEHIMLDLKARGWVNSLPGKDGGYVLAQRPDQITMGQVVRHFDGVLAPIGCVSVNQYEPCSQEATCRFRHLFLQIRNGTARFMDNATLASVYAGSFAVRPEAFDEALINGAGI